ncbi:MAG: YdcF family protein [Saprospiraceae bacterium]
MFFIVSKVLYFAIQPLNWVLALMLYSLFAKKKSRKRKALVAAIVLGFLFTNRFLYNQVIKLWELKTITADQITEPYDIGILLGGYSNGNILPRHDRQNFSHRAARFLNAYELYKMGKVKKLLLTGGSGDLLQDQPSEAQDMKGFFARIGVPAEDIIIEPDSRNTYENADFTKKILEERYPGASCLLITSAFHMRRSLGCFKKAGVACTPYSVDFITEKDRWAPENTIFPDRNGFYFWEILVKEWVGYLAYWAKGYL